MSLSGEGNLAEEIIQSTPQLRRAKEQDLAFVRSLIQDLESEEVNQDQFSATFLHNLHRPEIFYHIICHQNKPVGFVSLHVENLLHHWGKVAEIQELIIHRDARGKGIGKWVLDQMIVSARMQECKLIELCTNKKRIDAQRFYRNAGWNESHFKYTFEL